MEANDTLILLSLTQTEINAITSPDTGGMLYNSTTNTIQIFNGSAWENSTITDTDDIPEGSVNLYYTDVRVAANIAVALNTGKLTNATHTGEVTGSGALTVDSTAISNKVSITAVAGMEVLVNDAGTLKKADASDFLGTATEEFYFQRVETIDNSTGTAVEYFTEVQGGTEITNTATYTGGTYLININFVCLNTSTSGSVKVDIQVGGTSVFVEPYEVEPKDNDNIYYVGISKRIPITAGVKAVDVNLTNVGSGTGRIFEANVTITKK